MQATKTNLDAIHNRYVKRIKPGLDRWLADVSYNPDVRELIPGRLYSVASRTEAGLRHKVNWDGAQPSCSHEHFKAGTICSHIKASPPSALARMRRRNWWMMGRGSLTIRL
jgi:hypothetical protein